MRAATNTPTFAYSAATASKPISDRKAHDKLDPKAIKGKRESRDSAEHPNSNAVIFAFDVTGSMTTFPKIAQEKLPTLMGLLLRKGFLTDPQIMVCAFGDQTCDRVPLQAGQFESGIEIEDDITNLYLEGSGGGNVSESPELVFYLAARKTSLDCFEKRGKRGYLFLITDEMGRSISPRVIEDVFGEKTEESFSIKEIIQEAQKTYEVYVITPNGTSNANNTSIQNFWKELIGQNYLQLDDPTAICELVATTIGICESAIGHDDIGDNLKETGLSKTGVDAVSTALSRSLGNRKIAKVPKGSGLVSV
jgi:hypothetical protein